VLGERAMQHQPHQADLFLAVDDGFPGGVRGAGSSAWQ